MTDADVRIEVEDRTLTIERATGAFARTLTLPDDANRVIEA